MDLFICSTTVGIKRQSSTDDYSNEDEICSRVKRFKFEEFELNFANLSTTVLREIFSFLSVFDRLAANQVCQKWRAAMTFTNLRIVFEYGKHIKDSARLDAFLKLEQFLICLDLARKRPSEKDPDAKLNLSILDFRLCSARVKMRKMYIPVTFLQSLHEISGHTLTTLNLESHIIKPNSVILTPGFLCAFSRLKTLVCAALGSGYELDRSNFPQLETLHCIYWSPIMFPPMLRIFQCMDLEKVAGGPLSLHHLLQQCPLLEVLILKNVRVVLPSENSATKLLRLKHIVCKDVQDLAHSEWYNLVQPLLYLAPNLECFKSNTKRVDLGLPLDPDSRFDLPKLIHFAFAAKYMRFHNEDCVRLLKLFATSPLQSLKLKLYISVALSVSTASLIGCLFPALTRITLTGCSLASPKAIDRDRFQALLSSCPLLESITLKGLCISVGVYLALADLPEHVSLVNFGQLSRPVYDLLLREVQQRYIQRTGREKELTIVHDWAKLDPQDTARRKELRKFGFILSGVAGKK